MKLGPVTKFNKKNTATSKTFDNNVMSKNCGDVTFSPIYDELAAIRKLDFQRMVYKTYILINNNLLSCKS